MTIDDARLTKKQAKQLVIKRQDGLVHTFYNLPFGLIGADHTRKSVFKDINESFLCKLTGDHATAMGHGLVIIPSKKCKQSELLFVETEPQKVNK